MAKPTESPENKKKREMPPMFGIMIVIIVLNAAFVFI